MCVYKYLVHTVLELKYVYTYIRRLGSHAPGAKTVRRVLKIKNNSPVGEQFTLSI